MYKNLKIFTIAEYIHLPLASFSRVSLVKRMRARVILLKIAEDVRSLFIFPTVSAVYIIQLKYFYVRCISNACLFAWLCVYMSLCTREDNGGGAREADGEWRKRIIDTLGIVHDLPMLLFLMNA